MTTDTTLFISDLHLASDQPQLTALFSRFLQQQAKHCSALYILGDLFDAWLGDDLIQSFQRQIINEIKQISSAIPVYFMAGNRDFLIGEQFAKLSGVHLLNEPAIINLYGIPTLLMHGDSLCLEDKSHLRFRRLSHSRFMRGIYYSFPISWRLALANKIRTNSYKKNLRKGIRPATPSEIPRIMRQYNVSQFIHGHTHLPGIQYLQVENQWHSRHILSDWGPKCHYLMANNQGRLIHHYMI